MALKSLRRESSSPAFASALGEKKSERESVRSVAMAERGSLEEGSLEGFPQRERRVGVKRR